MAYDSSYVRLDYPGGDLPIERGACTDVVVRALRDQGEDLQLLVHEDVTSALDEYRERCSMTYADTSIDHRRVTTLARYFFRQGMALPVTTAEGDYRPGDIVSWNLGGATHIGVVSTQLVPRTQRYEVVHNLDRGAVIEDALFRWEITGHFRYFAD